MMFDYKAWLNQVFKDLSVPYSYGFYHGTSDTWVVALMYNEMGSNWTENKEVSTRYSFQINVYSNKDNSTVVDEVQRKMIEAGCIRVTADDSFTQDNFIQTTIYFQYERK